MATVTVEPVLIEFELERLEPRYSQPMAEDACGSCEFDSGCSGCGHVGCSGCSSCAAELGL